MEENVATRSEEVNNRVLQGYPEDQEGGAVDLFAIALVLVRNKRMIASVAGVVVVVAIIISLLLPNQYTAESKILAPQPTQSIADLAVGGNASIVASMLGGNSFGTDLGIEDPNDVYLAMLQSRTVADDIIGRFDLMKVYKKKMLKDTRKALGEATELDSGKGRIITISVTDQSPQRAAQIANAYVDELRKLNQQLGLTEAGQRRIYFERELENTKEKLSTAEAHLAATQRRTGILEIDSQSKAIVDYMTTLEAQIAATEVKVRAMQTFATPQNPELIRTKETLAGLLAQKAKLQRGKVMGPGEVIVPTADVPQSGLEYLRALRDVKYNEAVFELLSKELEAAKLDEGKEAVVIQVLDPAVPPERKSKPFRSLIVLLALLFGTVMGVVIAYAREVNAAWESDPVRGQQWRELKRLLRFRRKKFMVQSGE
jgi:tyrosine-protein kinase Etk/Wzc